MKLLGGQCVKDQRPGAGKRCRYEQQTGDELHKPNISHVMSSLMIT